MAAGFPDQKPTMPLEDFLVQARSGIEEDWQQLIQSSTYLNSNLEYILKDEHKKYKPQESGHWLAGPGWKEMFAWTACPADDIRGIFIDMKPLRHESSSYRSIGCALGVQHRQKNHPDIQKLTTVWKFLRLTHQVGGSEWTSHEERAMHEHFHNGFDPLFLSRNFNVLFLQLQLTTGPDSGEMEGRADSDPLAWADHFVMPLLSKIGQRHAKAKRAPIPVVQLYNNKGLEDFFNNHRGHLWFHVFRPSFMGLDHGSDDGPVRHIMAFNENSFQAFAKEIQLDDYTKHRKMFWDILDAINHVPEELSFND